MARLYTFATVLTFFIALLVGCNTAPDQTIQVQVIEPTATFKPLVRPTPTLVVFEGTQEYWCPRTTLSAHSVGGYSICVTANTPVNNVELEAYGMFSDQEYFSKSKLSFTQSDIVHTHKCPFAWIQEFEPIYDENGAEIGEFTLCYSPEFKFMPAVWVVRYGEYSFSGPL